MDDDTPDTVGPWTIKTVSSRTKRIATAAAQREGLAVGVWLDRLIGQWEGDGSPVAIPIPPGRSGAPGLAELADAMRETRALADAAGVKVPAALVRESFAMLKGAMRETRGLPAPAQRRKPPAAIEG